MTRFTFKLRSGNGDVEVDEVELPSACAARREAMHACGDFLREMDRTFTPVDAWEMEVTDEAETPICLLRFSFETFSGPDQNGSLD